MSDRYAFDADTTRYAETFQLEEIPQIDVGKFETVERAAVERVITDQQESIVRLQTDVLDVRSERNALERQLSKVEAQREELRERVGELEAQRPALEPKQVFANLGAALQEADDDLASERYRVDDVDFTLKTNVIQTDEGIRMHLPSLDESSVSANLSEVSFRLRAPRGETEDAGPTYTDVPDLRGQPHEVAARRLAAANLAVGTVERATDPETAPGTVIEQFPSPTPSPSPDRRSILCFPRRRKASRTHRTSRTRRTSRPRNRFQNLTPTREARVTTPDSQRIPKPTTPASRRSPRPTTSEPAWKRSGGQSSTSTPRTARRSSNGSAAPASPISTL